MNWPLVIRSLLMGIILGIAGVSKRDCPNQFRQQNLPRL